MAQTAAVIGNLALAQYWPRFSDTEPEPTLSPDAMTVWSTSAAGGHGLLGFISATRSAPSKLMTNLVEAPQLYLYQDKNLDIVAVSPKGDVLVIENRAQQSGLERWEPCEGGLLLLGSAYLQTSVANLTRKPLVYAYSPSEAIDEETSISDALSKFSRLVFRFGPDTAEALEGLRVQVRELHDEFVKWPGSYNQLLLAGSLDYCRSALTKLKRSAANVQQEVSTSIRNYYGLCSGIYDQYREATTALRRANLQYLQDKFDLIQEACAKHGVYSRLEDLDVADIPFD